MASLASPKLSRELAERILRDPSVDLTLGGRRTEAQVLFADIVGFTPRRERMQFAARGCRDARAGRWPGYWLCRLAMQPFASNRCSTFEPARRSGRPERWLVAIVFAGCGGHKPPSSPVAFAAEASDLFLPPVPTRTAHLEYVGPDRSYSGPARLDVFSSLGGGESASQRAGEIHDTDAPITLRLEDFDIAEDLEVVLASFDPPSFGKAPGIPAVDQGSFARDHDRLLIHFTRRLPPPDAGIAKVTIVADLAPTPQRPPKDWLAPGTTLYYGITLDDKPITKLVPMGLNVTIADPSSDPRAAGGGRVFDWQADFDPAASAQFTGERYMWGHRVMPARVADKAVKHSDVFEAPPGGLADERVDATCIFLPRAAMRNLQAYGAAAWDDVELGAPGLLQRVSRRQVEVQADDAVWTIPAMVARAGQATYVVAEDTRDPLILSAVRPSRKMRLMAIGRPPKEGGGPAGESPSAKVLSRTSEANPAHAEGTSTSKPAETGR